ncbi:hypothetical protein Pmani_035244 [Petrolisthes manimaculis]|uniref:Uncharacterized protein n=1 Tax=Petrolisthes manimaculis TaxID=1843537 RepID=A0AAE1NM47_9EUCA|nr:hypothetical protein Pmani_035244 [Petrolisthes manimaculis]
MYFGLLWFGVFRSRSEKEGYELKKKERREKFPFPTTTTSAPIHTLQVPFPQLVPIPQPQLQPLSHTSGTFPTTRPYPTTTTSAPIPHFRYLSHNSSYPTTTTSAPIPHFRYLSPQLVPIPQLQVPIPAPTLSPRMSPVSSPSQAKHLALRPQFHPLLSGPKSLLGGGGLVWCKATTTTQ